MAGNAFSLRPFATELPRYTPVVEGINEEPSLIEDHRQLIEAVGASPIAMVVTNPRRPDNPLEVVNDAFCKLTGFSASEVLNRNCRFLAGEEPDPVATQALRTAIFEKRPILTEIINYRRDGVPFRNGVMITPLFDAEGQLEWFLGSQVDLGPPDPDSLPARRRKASSRIANLSERQQQVLQLMAAGLLNKQIAWELKISEKTVKMHRSLLLERLGVTTSAEAIRIAVEAEP
jgi:PAS domain S-box-containing protein